MTTVPPSDPSALQPGDPLRAGAGPAITRPPLDGLVAPGFVAPAASLSPHAVLGFVLAVASTAGLPLAGPLVLVLALPAGALCVMGLRRDGGRALPILGLVVATCATLAGLALLALLLLAAWLAGALPG